MGTLVQVSSPIVGQDLERSAGEDVQEGGWELVLSQRHLMRSKNLFGESGGGRCVGRRNRDRPPNEVGFPLDT